MTWLSLEILFCQASYPLQFEGMIFRPLVQVSALVALNTSSQIIT